MPGVFIGSTEIVDLGKIKIGNTDVQEIYVGAAKIWPAGVGPDPTITFTWDPENDEALPGGTTFTRASVKQEFDGTDFTELASGTIPENSAAVGGGAQGYSPEPSATNLVQQSTDFDNTGNPGWQQNNLTPSDDGLADIGLNSHTMTATVVNSFHQLNQREDTGIAGSTPSTVSCIAKAGTGQYLALRGPRGSALFPWAIFDVTNGTLGGTNDITESRITHLGNGWYKCELTYTTSATLANDKVIFAIQDTSTAPTGSSAFPFLGAGETIQVAHMQFEDTAFATSPIITLGSTGTRGADVLDTGVVIPSGFSALLDVTLPNEIGAGNTISLLGPDATVEDILRVDASFNIVMDDGGTPVTIGTSSSGARFKVAYGRDAAGRSASLDGATAVTGGAPGAGHVGETIELGSRVGVNQSRCIHHLSTLFNIKKSDAELEALAS